MNVDGRIRQSVWSRAVVAPIVALAVVAAGVTVLAGQSAQQAAPPSAHAGMKMIEPGKSAYLADAPTLVAEGWKVHATSSAQGHGPAQIVNSASTRAWQSAPHARLAQSVTIDMRGARKISGLTYTPAAKGSHAIGRFEVSESRNGRDFTTVATGTWAPTKYSKKVGLPIRSARYVRLTALSAADHGRQVSVRRISLAGTPYPATLTGTTSVSSNPSISGQWSSSIGFPVIPVGAALLPNNMMLVWSADSTNNFSSGQNYTQTAILNLATGAVSPRIQTQTGHNMFCPGVAILPNGDIMITGGESSTKTSIYNAATNTWRVGPEMNIPRGYQAMTPLSDGSVFTLGGSWNTSVGGKMGEVWTPTGGWRKLTGVPEDSTVIANPGEADEADAHEWLIATSGGKVLQAGPSQTMHWITTQGNGTITSAGPRGTSGDSINGDAVYYDINKILTVGGAPSYNTAVGTTNSNVIDITGGNATVTPTSPMNNARAFANAVALPNGQVVVMGGTSNGGTFSDANSILNAEIWDPTTRAYTVMAPEATPRNYHSVGLLLPDGRVFSGGGGLCGNCSVNHPDGQIFSPPYLFNSDGSLRTRPQITSAPTAISNGQTITVTTNSPVTTFSMVRYGEATHSVDNDQRRIPLSIVSSNGNTYQLAIPSDPGIALPGPYMLFAMNSAGTPSVSTTMTVAAPANPGPTTTYGKTVMGDNPSVFWPLNETAGPAATDLTANDPGRDSASGLTLGGTSAVEGGTGTGTTFDGSAGQIIGMQSVNNPTTYSEEAWFKTTTTKGGVIMGFGDSTSGASNNRDRLIYMTNAGTLQFGTYNGSTQVIASPGAYNDGQWHHVVATQGSTGMTLYVDGRAVSSNTVTTPQNFTGYWRVGGESENGWPNASSSNYFAGTISDAAVYPAALTTAQVQAHFNASPAHRIVTQPTSTYGKAVFADGPTFYWPLADTTAPTVTDASGNNVVGTASSSGVTRTGAGPVDGGTGSAMTFDGSAGQIISAGSVTNPTVYSEEAWFKTTTTKGGVIIGFGDSASGLSNNYDRFVSMTNRGTLQFGTNGNGLQVIGSPGAYNDGKWHEVVATQGSAGMALYVDGKVAGTNPTTTAQNYTGYWRVGAEHENGWPNASSSNYFAGSISDAAVYPTALSAAQVSAHFAASPVQSTSTVSTPTNAYAQSVLADSPMLYWPASDAASPALTDATGHADAGITSASGIGYGGASAVEGATGSGLTLDGKAGQVISAGAVTNPGAFSEEAWFKTTTTKGGVIVGFGDSATGLSSNFDRYVWMTNQGTLQFGTYSGGFHIVGSSTAYNDGKWHQVVATQGPNGMVLYVDGKAIGTNTATTSQNYTGYWRVGAEHETSWPNNSSSNYFAGNISDVSIYTSALSAARVAAHYQASPAHS